MFSLWLKSERRTDIKSDTNISDKDIAISKLRQELETYNF